MKNSKFFLTTLFAAAAMGATAHAGFVWNGGETITQDLWQTESSWTLTDGTTWPTGGNGPLTPSSNAWNGVTVANASGTVDTFEGWALGLTLQNANLTVTNLNKLQSSSGCTLNLDAASVLTMTLVSGGNNGGTVTVNTEGTFNLNLSRNYDGDGLLANLGSTGIVNIAGAQSAKVSSVSAKLGNGSSDVIVNIIGGNTVYTRNLVALSGGATLSNSATYSFTDESDNTLTAAASFLDLDFSKYYAVKGASGYSVSYLVAGVSDEVYRWQASGDSSVWSAAVWTKGETTGLTIPDDGIAYFGSGDGLASTVAIDAATTVGRLIIDADYTFSGEDTNHLVMTNGGVVNSGATLILAKSGGAGGGFLRGEIEVAGTLQLNNGDVTGYNGARENNLHTITVDAGGVLKLNHSANETFLGTLNLNGTLSGKDANTRWDMYGGSSQIVVGDGANALIDENVKLVIRRNNAPITVGADATLTVNGQVLKSSEVGQPEGNGVLVKNGAGTLTINGNVNVDCLNVTAGTTKLSGSAAKTLAVLYGKASTIEIGEGIAETLVATTRLEFGDNSGGTSVLNIKSGSTLAVTGSNNASDYKNASFVLSEWYNSTTATIEGNLLAKDAQLLRGDSAATINVSGGTFAVKGFYAKTSPGSAVTVNVSNDGKLILGSGGVTGIDAVNVTLTDSTFAASESEISFSKNISLVGTGTFSTTKYDFSSDGTSIAEGTGTADITLSGIVSGDGALKKVGAGTLTLSGANTYSGGTTIEGGALVAANADALGAGGVSVGADAALKLGAEAVTVHGLSGEGSVALADGTAASTLTLDAAADGAFAGAFSGAISLTKSGAGTQTLSGASTHTGTTTVSAGTLVAANASALGTGDVSVSAGATLEHGIAGTTVAIGGALTTENGATLSFGSFVGQTAPLYSVAGDATIATGTIIDVESYAGLAENGGMVSLIDCAGTLSTTASDLVLKFCGLDAKSADSARYTMLSVVSGSLSLFVDSASMTWNGGASGVWSAGGEGWTGTSVFGIDVTAFENGDDVTFGDTGAGTVTLSGAVAVSSLTIDSANDYNFTGTNDAEIRGVGAFTKRGAGTATVDLATVGLSRYSGEFVVEAGTLALSAPSDATFANTISGAGTFAKTGAGALTLTGDLSALTGTLAVNEGKVLFSNYDGTVAAKLAGAGTIAKEGAGTLTLSGESTETLALLTHQHGMREGSKLVVAPGARVNVGRFVGLGINGSSYDYTVYETEIAGVMNVSGDVSSIDGNTAAFMMANSGGTHLVTVADGGVLNLANASVSNRDGRGTLTVAAGGEANFGIGLHVFTNNEGWGLAKVVLDGGTINVGTNGTYAGISTEGRSNTMVEIKSGTIGSLADSWSSSLDIAATGDLTIDTTKRTISEMGNAAATPEGADVTLSGALSSAGTLTVTGAGTVSVSNMSFNSGTETRVEGGATLDLTGNSCGNTGGSAVLAIDGEGSTVKLANGAWGNGTNFGAGFAQSQLTLSNGGVLEVTATQDESTAGRRGFSVTAGTGTYRYSGTGTSYIAHNGSNDAANQFIGLAAGATLNFDVAADAVLNVSKIIALNGDSATTATTGNLTKSGAGTLVLDPNGGTNNFSGTVTLAGGALEIAGAGALGTSSNVVFSATGTTFGATAADTTLDGLTLTFGDAFATDAATGVSISNGTTFTDTTITFSDAVAAVGTVLLLSGYTGTVDDFNYVGDGRIFVDAGNLYFSTFMGDLYWNGAVNDVWNTTDANWTEDGLTNRTFVNASSVTFRTADAAVQLAGAFSVSAMTVSESVAFSAAEDAEASSISVNYTDLAIAEGKTLTIGEDVTLDLSGGDAQAGVSRSDILGSGTVKLKLTTAYGNTLSLDGFSGTTYVAAGNFRINGAKFGDTLHLAGGVNFELFGGSTVELGADKNLVIDGTTQVHQNSNANLTFNGSVTGAGTYDRRGAGTLTFNGAVALGGFLQDSNDNAVTTFGGTADFADGATLNFARGSASFNGATAFGDNATLTHSSSAALSFNGATTLGSGMTISHSSGALSFTDSLTIDSVVNVNQATNSANAITVKNLVLASETVGISNGVTENNRWHTSWLIEKLSLAQGLDSAELALTTKHNSSTFSVYELGASGVTDSGDFVGTIRLSSTKDGDNRSASLVISNETIAKNAVVNLAELASPGAQLALGVNAASVTVGGLESAEAVGDRAKVYSGKVAYGAEGGAALGDGTTRALVIDTTAHADTEHVFRGVIGADLELTKTGAGTQVLTNAGNAFAALEVSGGTLAATNVGALGAADSVTLTDGTLELRGVAGAGNDAAEFAKSLTGTGTFALTNTSKVAVAADKLSGFTGTLNVADEASTLQVSAAADSETTVGAKLDGAGTFEKHGDGTLVLSAAAAADRTGSTTVSAGTLALTDARALGSGEVSLADENATLELRGLASFGNTVNSDAGAGKLALTGGSNLTMNFGAQLSNFGGDFDLDAGTSLNLGIDADDVAAFGLFRNAAEIGDGATLGIDAGAADAAFAMALSGTGTLEKLGTGTLTLGAAPADAFTGTLKIAAGTLKLDGTWTLNNDVAGTGALEIAGKITAHASKFTSEFTGATTVLENSELEIWTDTTGSLSTAVTGAGTLTKTGDGTLSLAAGTTVKTVNLRAGGLAGVNLGSGQTLKISYDDVKLSGTNTLTAGTLSFLGENSELTKLTIADGTTTVGGDLKIDVNVEFPSVTEGYPFDDAEISNTYTLIEVADGATLAGWGSLTKDNFLVNGVEITSHREAVVTSGEAGQISLSLESFDLVWNGGDGVWNVNDDGNTVWKRADDGAQEFYMNSDRVTFAGTETVTLGTNVAPQTITVKNGTLTLDCDCGDAYVVKYGTTTIESGSTLALTVGGNREYFAQDVTGAGTLRLDVAYGVQGASLSTLISGEISDAAGLTLEKTGSGELTISDGKLSGFTADNTVKVSEGTVLIDAFASIGGAELNVKGGASAEVDVNADEVLQNSITGGGTFTKSGDSGALTISSSNTQFTGTFEVRGGTVVLTKADGMGLATAGTVVSVQGSSRLELQFSDTYKRVFKGQGEIVAKNDEKLTLSGSGDDFTGTFAVEGKTVVARSATALGNGTIRVADADRTVEFRLTEAGEFAGAFAGSGMVKVVSDSKTLTLSNVSDASGDAFTGTMKLEASAVAKNAAVLGSSGATVEVGQNVVLTAESGTLAAKLSGSGVLAKTTDGTLELANADNDFTGMIGVEEGRLLVRRQGALGSVTKIDLSGGTTFEISVAEGDAFVLERAVSGQGDLLVSGDGDFEWRLSSKTFHGNMTFSGVTAKSDVFLAAEDGTVILRNAATWRANGGFSTGESNWIELRSMDSRAVSTAVQTMAQTASVSGIASTLISGSFRASSGDSGSVVLRGLSVTPTTTAAGGTGALLSFSLENAAAAQNAPITLSGDGSVTLNGVSVEVLLGEDIGSAFDVSEIRLVNAPDPQSVVEGETETVTIVLADGSVVEYHYRNGWLTLNAVPTGMNLAYAAMVTLPTETFAQDVRSLHRRMEQRRFGVEDRNEWQFFAQAQTISADAGSDKNDSATFDYSTYGALVGADVRVGETTLFGLALAYDRGTADIHDDQGEITSDAYRATLYAGTVFADYLYAEAGVHVGFSSNEIDRKGDYDRNKGDADAWSAGAFATVGGVIPTAVEGLCFTPHVGLAYLTTHVESFEEHGTSSMDVDSISADSLRASVGLGAHVAFGFGEVPTRFTLDVSYSRECLDDDVDAKIRTEDGSLTRTEKAFAEDVISVGAGLDFSLSANTGVFLNYTADFGLNSDVTHRANAGFRFTW
ncbi:MAG: autotransporter-associated beta strand repeat-containing protein [Candidatus Spyradosoma sp.]